ncbi:MAG: hypothetical protein MI924_30990, partial [Chloroflexales bacterium]|nr:hypothetical protein [Chloroflexales bacterium]
MRRKTEISAADQPGIGAEAHAVGVGDVVVLAVDDEAVEVRIGPIKGGLNAMVAFGDRGVTANEAAATDEWADPAEADA